MNTQNDAILAHLKGGNSITALEALHRFGCLRLAARIYQLRQRGHDIEGVPVQDGRKRYERYSLK